MVKKLFLSILVISILGFGAIGAFFTLNKNKKTEISPIPTITEIQIPTETITNSTKTPNKEVLEMVQQKVKDMLQDSGDSSASNGPKSFVGTIAQIENEQITINYKNEIKTVAVNEETVFIDAKRNKTKLESIKAGQDIIAMGYFNQYGNFEAKRVVVTDLTIAENKNEIVLGKIVDISQSSPIFVLIPIKNKDNQYQIKTDSKTEILDKDNNKLTIDKLKSGQKIVVIIQPDTKMVKTFYVSKIITLESPTAQIPENSTNN